MDGQGQEAGDGQEAAVTAVGPGPVGEALGEGDNEQDG